MPFIRNQGEDVPTRRENRYGHTWEWRDRDVNIRAHWKSTSGNLVMVFPPNEDTESWWINICDEEDMEIAGENAGNRAFAVAEGYTRQVRT